MIKKLLLLFVLLAGPVFAASIDVYPARCLVVRGENCTIQWESSGAMANQVNITVWHGAAKVGQIDNVPNVPGDNEKVWLVPASLAVGTYIFRVTTIDNLVQGQSENEVNDRGIHMDSSKPSGNLVMGSYYNFGWLGFGLPYSSGVIIELYRSGILVGQIGNDAMNSSHGCGRSTQWIVGKLMDPATEMPLPENVPAGSGYKIRVRQYSGNYYDESAAFSIVVPIDPKMFRNRFKLRERILVFPGPGDCPMCGELQLAELWETLKTLPHDHRVELWHAGRSLGVLSKLNRAGGKQSLHRIDFGNSFQRMKNGAGGFELRVFDNRGRLVETNEVVLNFKGK